LRSGRIDALDASRAVAVWPITTATVVMAGPANAMASDEMIVMKYYCRDRLLCWLGEAYTVFFIIFVLG
jgi:hypothetical protein